MKKKTALLILFGLLLALFFLPALAQAEDPPCYYTKTELANLWGNGSPISAEQDTGEPTESVFPRNPDGSIVIPDGAIALGDDSSGGKQFLVPRSWVKVYRSGQNGLKVYPSPNNSETSGDSRRTYIIQDPSNSLLSSTGQNDRVLVILDDNSFDYGQIHSLNGNMLTLKTLSETDDTALSYISQMHYDWHWDHMKRKAFDESINLDKNMQLGFGEAFGEYHVHGSFCGYGEINYNDTSLQGFLFEFQFVLDADFATGENGISFGVKNVGKTYSKDLFTYAKWELIPGIIQIDLTPRLVFEAKADGEAKFKLRIVDGFYCIGAVMYWQKSAKIKTTPIRENPITTVADVDLTGTAFAGFEWGPGISFLEGLCTISLDYKAGVEFEGKNSEVGLIQNGSLYHACEKDKCWELTGKLRLGPLTAHGRGVFWGWTFWDQDLADLGLEVKFTPFLTAYSSHTFNTAGINIGLGGLCPHKAPRRSVRVVDTENNPIKGAIVSYKPVTVHYNQYFMATTNDNGYADLYIPYDTKADPPSNETVHVEASKQIGDKIFSRVINYKVTEGNNPVISLELRQVHITFADPPNIHPKSTNLPGELSYYLFDQTGIQIPDTIPEKNCFQFQYWSTSPDGNGEKIKPGSFFQADRDTTLYPIYKAPLMDSYSVVYNLNGGQSGPMTQTVDIDKDAVLSTEPAVWENHKFLGWSYTDTSAQAEFPAGKRNILKNEEHKRVIVLYAVWAFDPTNPPVKLTFDMNGGPEQQKPSDQWVRRNIYVPISQVVPVWNKLYTFSGWNEDKYASVGDYSPGDTIYMDESKTLYAIWVYNPAPEPYCITFADSGTGTAYDLPSPVYFSRDPGTLVRLPDQIPLKREKQFVGWNTKEDGSGDSYAPGASFAPGGDLTLYAQWKTLRNSFIVLYNANGGSSAPPAQEFYLDQIALLTSEPAVWTNHKFLGWALTGDAFEPDYPVGAQNVLRNPDGDPLVELYAVWAFSPVDMPLKIVYDMNGGPENRKPSVQHAAAGTHVVITHTVPTWDKQHTFKGWGLNPTDTEPFYQPGDTIVLIQDMKLYALWNVKYTIIQGNGSSWTSNRSHGLRFVADGNIDYFYHLQIDGTPVLRSRDYKLSSGSTIADLSRKLLIRAGKGVHTIRFVYKDGVAEGTFTVTKAVPDTGDTANFPLYAGLILLGFAGIGIPILRRRRKKT